jgi:putative transposase
VLSGHTGPVEIELPLDRAGTFEPQVVKKREGRLGEVDETVSRITDRVLEEMQSWQTRPIDEVYAAIFIDAVVVKICDGVSGNSTTRWHE